MEENCQPPYVMAMELNDEGALWMEKGLYKQAIHIFLEALKLSEDDVPETICTCKFCSLDECVMVGHSAADDSDRLAILPPHHHEINPSLICEPCNEEHAQAEQEQRQDLQEQNEDGHENLQQQRAQRLPHDSHIVEREDLDFHAEKEEEEFMYKKPICMLPKSIEEGHAPGITLSLIIVFNLGLAHHLNGLAKQERQRN